MKSHIALILKRHQLVVAVAAAFCLMNISLTVEAQENTDAYTKTIDSYFEKLNSYPKENIYMHLDKPYYSAGDRMFYRGYLVNDNTRSNRCFSNFIYVEMAADNDSIIFRQKIRRDSLGVFKGSYKFAPDMPKGNYYIRAYTSWMQNWSPDYFFCRNVYVGNAIVNDITSSISYSKEDSTHYNVHYNIMQENSFFRQCTVHVAFYSNGMLRKKRKIKSDDKGRVTFPLEFLSSVGEKVVMRMSLDDPEYKLDETFVVPVFKRDYALSFFPEGGHLLAGEVNNVAFKAQANTGFSTEVKGVILNMAKDTVATINTVHDGMGETSLRAVKGDIYTAVVTDSVGLRKTFRLPEPETNAMALSVFRYKDRLMYQIKKADDTVVPDTMNLIIHSAGKILLNKPLDGKMERYVNANDLPEGIIHFLLVKSGSETPVSERLYFNRKRNDIHVAFVDSTLNNEKRGMQHIAFRIENGNNESINGDFSVSVTDAELMSYDDTSDNIYTSFLLTSQLRGFIEHPAYYFSNDTKEVIYHTDLLMMTHGWRKYTDFNFTKPYNDTFKYKYEVGQVITGRVKNLIGQGPKGKTIYALAPKENIFTMTKTDDDGHFVVDDIEFKDSTSFVLQAPSKGLIRLEIIGDEYQYPALFNKNLFPQADNLLAKDYLNSFKNDYVTAGGMRVFNLKEVTVTAKKGDSDEYDPYLSSASFKLVGDEMRKYSARTALDVLQQMPGVYVAGDKITVRGGDNVELVVDEVPMTMEESVVDYLRMIPSDDLEYMALLKGAEAGFFGKGADGVIAMKTRRGTVNPVERPVNVIVMKPQGYAVCEEFYNPVYDTPEKRNSDTPDLRTTLYWNPQLKQDDGVFNLRFYNNDRTEHFHIDLEGVSETGVPFHYSTRIP